MPYSHCSKWKTITINNLNTHQLFSVWLSLKNFSFICKWFCAMYIVMAVTYLRLLLFLVSVFCYNATNSTQFTKKQVHCLIQPPYLLHFGTLCLTQFKWFFDGFLRHLLRFFYCCYSATSAMLCAHFQTSCCCCCLDFYLLPLPLPKYFFVYQLMYKWTVLKTILKFTLKFRLKQLQQVSV